MVGAIVQARMGSSRLPGKVMLKAAGKPLLGHLVARLNRCMTLEKIIVATSTADRDKVIVDFCKAEGIPIFRGSENDVLDRYYHAAIQHRVDTIVRVTSDCPLIDPELIDEMVLFFRERKDDFDLVTNRHPLTFPDGTDFDITSLNALRYVWKHASEAHQREHVVPYFWESGMRVHNFEHPDQLFYQHRWTLDYPEDYELIRHILDAFSDKAECFGTRDILTFLAENPHLPRINAKYIPSKSEWLRDQSRN